MNLTNIVTLTVLSAVVSFGIFLLLRSVLLWYWKVDFTSKNLKEQTLLLRDIKKFLSSQDLDRKIKGEKLLTDVEKAALYDQKYSAKL